MALFPKFDPRSVAKTAKAAKEEPDLATLDGLAGSVEKSQVVIVNKNTQTLPHGVTMDNLEKSFGHDPAWARVNDDSRWLNHLAENVHLHRLRERTEEQTERLGLPDVTCGDCANFTPDLVNPNEGMGQCRFSGVPKLGQPSPWPQAKRRCILWYAAKPEKGKG